MREKEKGRARSALNTFGFRPDATRRRRRSMQQCRPYAPAGPSIHPTIYILARGPFALCQAILIPIYHLFLTAPSFLSARSSPGASSFFKPFDSNWFLSRPLIRTPFVLSLFVSFCSRSLQSFFLLFLRLTQSRVRICSPVAVSSGSIFLFLATT